MRPPGTASPSAKSIQEVEIPLAVMVGRMKKFSENTFTILEVMDSSTVNFNSSLHMGVIFDPSLRYSTIAPVLGDTTKCFNDFVSSIEQ